MLVKLNETFADLDNNPIKIAPNSDKNMTVRDALKVICTAELQSDTQGSAQDVLSKKMNNFDIYLKVREAKDEVDLTVDEVKHLKDRAPFILNVLTLGPLIRMFEGKTPV